MPYPYNVDQREVGVQNLLQRSLSQRLPKKEISTRGIGLHILLLFSISQYSRTNMHPTTFIRIDVTMCRILMDVVSSFLVRHLGRIARDIRSSFRSKQGREYVAVYSQRDSPLHAYLRYLGRVGVDDGFEYVIIRGEWLTGWFM